MSDPLTQGTQISLWSATAREKPLRAPRASGQTHTDVAIIGGGYTGLSTALHLAEQGAIATLLEAGTIGAGASGVNGGQVIPGLKRDPEALEQIFGECGPAITDLFSKGPDLVFSLIDRYAIQCSPLRKGWILAAHAVPAMKQVRERWRQWHDRGADISLLTASEISQLTGTSAYTGGLIDRRAGTIQPLAYARGLARAAVAQGAKLYEASEVTHLGKSGGKWRLAGDGFEISAGRVVIATDAYSGKLMPALERSLLTVSSLQIATEPLPAGIDARILPGQACLSETRKVAIYMRRDPEGRVLIGGRGPVGDGMPDRLYEDLHRRLLQLFPNLRGIGISHRWHGKVGLTIDELPHLHEPEDGVMIGVGYNGRGVAAATTMGRIIAERIIGGPMAGVLPVASVSSIPWRVLRQPLLTAAVTYYRLRDQLGLGA
ncbi:MAG: NAD(P)/FAD-dependent oxidoreductase [Pseudomonadota bacterium]